LASGAAVTTLTLAVMRGGGDAGDPLVLPPSVTTPADSGDGFGPDGLIASGLPTQIGGKPDSPAHDPEKLGFSGNMDEPYPGSETYPRDIKLAAREIPVDRRDELVAEVAATYSIAIPDDLLEL